jgi:4-cresol dehydrogenase (hydroxylating) flavoprotein subunit
MPDAAQAIQQWTQQLGEANVSAEADTLQRYARSTTTHGTRPCCVLYPTTTEDVRAVLRIAGEHGVVVYPFSRGKNWGYGDACAPTEGAAIIDLSRMNRILELNTELGYVVIEPGVSQQQLYDYLQEQNAGLWFDSSGAGPDASLVGNTLDRGFGHTRYGDHFATSCGMEVVLADGRVLNTGYGHYENAQAGRVYRYGVGPFLDGIFCQSNLGVVTQLGLWLMPAPEAFSFFYISVDRDEELSALVDLLRPLRMQGILNSAVHIGNDLRILSGDSHYPWDKTDGAGPLSQEVRETLRREADVGAWTAGGSLTGTAAHVRASRKALRAAFRPLAQVHFVDDHLIALGEWAASLLNRFGLAKTLAQKLRMLKPNYGLLKGIPTTQPIHGTQWRLRRPPEHTRPVADPLDLGCGLAWMSPVLPATGRHAEEVRSIAEPIFARFAFEPLITFTMINERAMIAIMNVAFDHAESEEAARADACYHAMTDAMMGAGYVPYRVGLGGLPRLVSEGDVFWEVASGIKRALDPGDIIARGRYIPPL